MDGIRLACPACQVALRGVPDGAVCDVCTRVFEHRDGIYRFMSAVEHDLARRFHRQYTRVRLHDGARRTPGQYRRLPLVDASDPRAGEWRVRQASFDTLRALLRRRTAGSVADLGAGNGWLSHRLSTLGHPVVAIDRLDDDVDGLAVCRHYATPILCAQASFDALPLASGSIELVVLNGSLHYSPDPARTLAEARRVLAPDGRLVVMDSPMFRGARAGEAMLATEHRRLARECGLDEVVQPGVGYLTFETLGRAAAALGLRSTFVPSRGSFGWSVRRQIGRVRLRRAPAAFGVWVAQ